MSDMRKVVSFTVTRNGEEAMKIQLICGNGEDSDDEEEELSDKPGFNPEWRMSECDPSTSSAPTARSNSSSVKSSQSGSGKLLPSLDLGRIMRTFSGDSGKSAGSGGSHSQLPTASSSPMHSALQPHSSSPESVFSPRSPAARGTRDIFSPRDSVIATRERLGSAPVPIPDSINSSGMDPQLPVAPSAASSCSPPQKSALASGAQSPHGIVLTVQYTLPGSSTWNIGLSLDSNGIVYSTSRVQETLATTRTKLMTRDDDVAFSTSTIGSLSISAGSSTGKSSTGSMPIRSGTVAPSVGSEGSGKGSTPNSFSKRIGAYILESKASIGQILPILRSRQSTPAPLSGGSSLSSKPSSLGAQASHLSTSGAIGGSSGIVIPDNLLDGVQSPRQGMLSPLSPRHGNCSSPLLGSSSPPLGQISRTPPSGYSMAEMNGYASSARVSSPAAAQGGVLVGDTSLSPVSRTGPTNKFLNSLSPSRVPQRRHSSSVSESVSESEGGLGKVQSHRPKRTSVPTMPFVSEL